jgi:hypothetical protein
LILTQRILLSNNEDNQEKKIDEVIKKLNDLEEEVKSQKTDSLAESVKVAEDQLFFGLIIALLIFFINLPVNALASFLQSVFVWSQSGTALTNATDIKYLGIAFFLFSSLARYATVVTYHEQEISKKFRYASFESWWLGLDMIILITTINLFATLTHFLGLSGLAVTLFILTFIFLGMSVLERKVLKYYVHQNLMLEKYSSPIGLVFSVAILGLCIALEVEITAIALGFGFSEYRFLFEYAIIVFLTMLLVRPRIKKDVR